MPSRPRRAMLVIAVSAQMFACTPLPATAPDEIAPQRISAQQYAGFSCDQLSAERSRITTRLQELRPQLELRYARDQIAAAADKAVGRMSAALPVDPGDYIEGDGPGAEEYARLKGERDAVEQLMIRQSCPPLVPSAPPTR